MSQGEGGGQPPLWKEPSDIEGRIEDYFNETPEEEWTITGLALALGTNRSTLANYEKKGKFFDTINRAKTRVEYSYEKSLRRNGRAGDIFGLKNFGWKDKQEIDQNNTGNIQIEVVRYDDKNSA